MRADSLFLVQECLRLIGQDTTEKGEDEHSSFNQILRIKAVHFLAFLILVYVGVEVTIGGRVIQPFFISEADVQDQGWIVTFMLDVRGGGPPTGYISSVFFGGLCLCLA